MNPSQFYGEILAHRVAFSLLFQQVPLLLPNVRIQYGLEPRVSGSYIYQPSEFNLIRHSHTSDFLGPTNPATAFSRQPHQMIKK